MKVLSWSFGGLITTPPIAKFRLWLKMLKFIYAFEKFQYLISCNVLLLYEEIDNFDGLGWVQPVLIVIPQLLFTCSKSVMKTSEQSVESVQS